MPTTIAELRVGTRRDEPIAIEPLPRVQWRIDTDVPDWRQTSAEIEIEIGGERHVHEHASSESVAVAWPFAPLRPRDRVRLRARVTGSDGTASDWSAPLEVLAAFLADGEWDAEFIELATPERPAQPVLLRTEFDLPAPVDSAYLYATAHGVYQAEINGAEVDSAVLKPGWTAYESRLALETTDVTALVHEGSNAIGILLAGGWYTLQHYGPQPAVAAQLLVTHPDGSTTVVRTDGTWQATGDGPITDASIYDGETYDARLEQPGWSAPGFDGTAWDAVAVRDVATVPTATAMPQIRRTERLAVRDVVSNADGRIVVDFGQNLVGWVEITVDGPTGTEITLRHGEVTQVLDDDEVYGRILFGAKVTDRLILDGGPRTWQPRFTFHGFRYLEIVGWPGVFDVAAVTAIVVHNDMVRTGWFESSSELLNRFHENSVWSMRGNFLAVPTDCPQRAERRGWTGDLQLFSPTGAFLYDCEGFLRSWLVDVAVEQKANGYVPVVVPAHPWPDGHPWPGPATGWSDASTIVPVVLHERYGDPGVLRDQLESMTAHVDLIAEIAGANRLWEHGFHFGDWLDPTAPPETPSAAKTDPDLLASAYFFRSASRLALAAEMLGDEQLARRARGLAEEVRLAWLREYVTASGRTMSDSQTGYALAIVFGIEQDPERRQHMGDRLAELVSHAGFTIATGLLGTPYVTDALTETGHLDIAARLILQTRNPSWLYPVTMGATTIWERWDSLTPDGAVNRGEMTSFNHYALGAVADWLHRTIAGLAPAAAGYREILVAPRPIPGLDHAKAEHDTPYGRAAAGWAVTAAGTITVTVTVPPNATAILRLPDAADERLGAGTHSREIPDVRGTLPPAITPLTGIGAAVQERELLARILSALDSSLDVERYVRAIVFMPHVPLATQLAQDTRQPRARVEAAILEIAGG